MAVIKFDNGNSTGIWNDALNWVGDALPGAGDVATFDSTSVANCSIDIDPACLGIDIQATYSGVITQAAGISMAIGASGIIQAAGTFTGGDSAITVTGTSNTVGLSLSGGTFNSTSGIFTLTICNFLKTGGVYSTPASGELIVGGTGTCNVTPGGTSANEQFGKVTFNPNGGVTNVVNLLGNIAIDDDFIVGSTNGGKIEMGSHTNTIGGSFTGIGRIDLAGGTYTIEDSLILGGQSAVTAIVFGETSSIILNGTGANKIFCVRCGSTETLNNVKIVGEYTSVTATTRNSPRITGLLEITGAGSWDIHNASSVSVQMLEASSFTMRTGASLTQSTKGGFTAGFQLSGDSLNSVTLEASTTFAPDPLIIANKDDVVSSINVPASILDGPKAISIQPGASTGTDRTFVMPAGTFTIADDIIITDFGFTQNMTVDMATNSPTFTCRDLEFKGSSSGDMTLTTNGATLNIGRNLEYNSTGSGAELITAGSGTFNVGGDNVAHNIDLGGGTFTANTSTVAKTGTGTMTHSGTPTYFNFTFGVATHSFTASSTVGVSGTLTSSAGVQGSILRSTSTPTTWGLNLSGSSTLLDKADVKDSDASSGILVSAVGSLDSGNNTNWDFVGEVSKIVHGPTEKGVLFDPVVSAVS